MPFTGIYGPEQVAMLYKVLDDHCAKFGIERSTREHEDAVYLVMSLLERGAHTAEELSAALDDAYAGSRRRRASPLQVQFTDSFFGT